MAARREASESQNKLDDVIPQVVLRVIEDPEDAASEDQGYQRLSDADIEVFVIDELESRLYEWSTRRRRFIR
jgi:hypothetical protein